MTDDMHQKHEALLASYGTEIKILHKGQDEMRGDMKAMSNDMKSILSAVQSNSTSGTNGIAKMAGAGLTFLVGFMTLIIMPMQEDTEKRRLEQDEKNKLQAEINAVIARESGRHEVNENRYEGWLQEHGEDIKDVNHEIAAQAIEQARQMGHIVGRLESIERQVNAIDSTGLRSELE